jgi:hypothetical protein
MQPVILKSNEFWGRRSGAYRIMKGDLFKSFMFVQQKWGSGSDRKGKQKHIKLLNVNKKWFS